MALSILVRRTRSVSLIYGPSRRNIAAIPLPSGSRQRGIDKRAGIETKPGMSNAARTRELLPVILPADRVQHAIFFPLVLRGPLLFSVLDGVFARFTRKYTVVDVCSRSLSLFLTRFSLFLSLPLVASDY